MQNISKEDYLGIIYKYRDRYGEIKPTIIADKLQISSAAVTDMLKKLDKDGYINYKKYKGIQLTKNGEDYARSMVRRHRIWEIFLHQIVGLPWDKVHDEAHLLEHSASDELINRLEEMCDFPEFDPHGDPIPSKEGKLPKLKNYKPLSELKKGENGYVVRVSDYDESFLVFIRDIGVKLNENISIKEKRKFDDSIIIEINGKAFDISGKVADNIFVQVKSNIHH